MSDKKYQATGHFADREIRTFARHVKDNVLDEKEAMEVWGLNERQIPQLKEELIAAGFIKEEIAEEAKATKPLKPIEPVVPPLAAE